MKRKLLTKVLAVTLGCSLIAGSANPCIALAAEGAHITDSVSALEKENSKLSTEAATEGMVLLENNGVLPMAKSGKIALFGYGAYATKKGGTGSGDVNQRNVVTVWDGLKNAGYTVTTEDYLGKAKADYEKKDSEFVSPTGNRWESYKHEDMSPTDAQIAGSEKTDTAIYVIARNSGEGDDRTIAKGDYYLYDSERITLEKIAKSYGKVIVLLNVGGVIDTKFYDEINGAVPNGLDAMLLMSQGGQNVGTALVQILQGQVNPSGKLSDTWAENYEDYPASSRIGNNDGDALEEDYNEDIYVGYRYFDTFGKTPAYAFGYGMSYTSFDTNVLSVTADKDQVSVKVKVTNTGNTYAGKEVVQVYFSAPDGTLEKPYQELAGYAKTETLKPGESQTMTISYKTTEMSSYSEAAAAYIMEDGNYVIRVGNSSRNTHPAAVLTLGQDVLTEQLSDQFVQDENIKLYTKAGQTSYTYPQEAAEIAAAQRITLDFTGFRAPNSASPYDDESITTYLTAEEAAGYKPVKNETVETVTVDDTAKLIDVYNGELTLEQFVANLDIEQMAHLVNGNSRVTPDEPIIGAQANSVKGAAGETSSLYYDSLGIPNIVLADGPAGIRITQQYTDEATGQDYYQYCTAWPIGTMLAQSFNDELIEKVGEAIGKEMDEYGVTLWLAPGMNIHRDPLCGRNFEYYSEDPFLTGTVGTAATLGVQSNPGIGVTIKHYAANSQEINRNTQNNTLSERAFREIYLKAFEMVVKSAQPMAIMSSYNKNNGTYAADDYNLLTDLPRGEWGFEGLVMTDWGAGGRASVDKMMHAGNDLIMSGGTQDRIINSYNGNPGTNSLGVEDGVIVLGDIQNCTMRILNVIMQSKQFAQMNGLTSVSYTQAHGQDLTTYNAVEKNNVIEADVQAKLDEAERLAEEAKAAKEYAAKLEADAKAAQAEIDAAKALAAQKEKEAADAKKDAQAYKVATKKVKISSLKNNKSKRAALKFKKVANADGYQIQYSVKKNFGGKKSKLTAKTSNSIKKLKKGTTYYVRVRAYKKDSAGKKIYGLWSTAKNVAITK